MNEQPQSAPRKTLTLKKPTKEQQQLTKLIEKHGERIEGAETTAAESAHLAPELWRGLEANAERQKDGRWLAIVRYKGHIVSTLREHKTEPEAYKNAFGWIAGTLPCALQWIDALARVKKEAA